MRASRTSFPRARSSTSRNTAGRAGSRCSSSAGKRRAQLEPALWRTYGLTLPQFEEVWRKHVRRRYGWVVFLSHSVVFWTFAAIVLLALFGIRRRRDRARMAVLRATEPPDDPAYWLEVQEPGDDGNDEPRDDAS